MTGLPGCRSSLAGTVSRTAGSAQDLLQVSRQSMDAARRSSVAVTQSAAKIRDIVTPPGPRVSRCIPGPRP